MLTLYSYPELFGVADNNPFGLKVYAFLRLAGLPFNHQHIFDSRQAPHGQLPYIDDDGTTVGDSSAIVAHLIDRHGLSIDSALSSSQHTQAFCVNRILDDLYWSMSYSRWKDDRYWPDFRDAVLRTHANVTAEDMDAARAYNFERYRYQGIGRYAPEEAYRRGLDDLRAIAAMMDTSPFFFGATPTSVDASIYGFVANILFYPIDTPLRAYVVSQPGLVQHCEAIHKRVMGMNSG
ncbi:glutathione S-transferase family protein [Bordetella genomosp. 11]|uniref:Glutathione S-transferase n=1 Tax=Bordetella genomosp. 11 TaxID=1416808 RepID=A0A261ULF3_9BORD|nr:glutathione S-transferase family protein [Bordetella genomosp. 11]OZI62461.1 glutathione S-transferase [Bordetella genomosp. 11]